MKTPKEILERAKALTETAQLLMDSETPETLVEAKKLIEQTKALMWVLEIR